MTTWQAFVAWRRQRLPLVPFLGVALVVAAAARDLALSTVLTALVQVGALRLWDDVASRVYDARRHPDRVVVRGPAAPFARAAVLAVLLAALQALLMGHVVGFVVVVTALGLVYAAPLPRPLRAPLVLLKYPAIAVSLSPSSPAPGHLLLLVGCFAVDEWLTGEAPLPQRALPFVLTFIGLSLL